MEFELLNFIDRKGIVLRSVIDLKITPPLIFNELTSKWQQT